jgi:hypothetical protein
MEVIVRSALPASTALSIYISTALRLYVEGGGPISLSASMALPRSTEALGISQM